MNFEFETKFSIGEKVYWFNYGKIKETVIKDIKLEKHDDKYYLFYYIEDSDDKYNKTIPVSEDKLFKTIMQSEEIKKDYLLSALYKGLNEYRNTNLWFFDEQDKKYIPENVKPIIDKIMSMNKSLQIMDEYLNENSPFFYECSFTKEIKDLLKNE